MNLLQNLSAPSWPTKECSRRCRAANQGFRKRADGADGRGSLHLYLHYTRGDGEGIRTLHDSGVTLAFIFLFLPAGYTHDDEAMRNLRIADCLRLFGGRDR